MFVSYVNNFTSAEDVEGYIRALACFLYVCFVAYTCWILLFLSSPNKVCLKFKLNL